MCLLLSRITPVALVWVILAAPLPAQKPAKPEKATKETIDTAIARGVQWLLEHQTADGTWAGPQFERYRTGTTALVAYTLLKCGLDSRHPAVNAAFRWIEREEIHRTYDIGVTLMAWEAYGKDRPDDVVRELAKKLVRSVGNGRRVAGSRWGYPNNHSGVDPSWADLSNTQYAVLGLRAARACGVKVGGAGFWARIAADLLEDQESYGGFGYRRGNKATASMTVAGTTALIVCNEALKDIGAAKGTVGKTGVGIRRSFMWLDKNFAVDRNIDFAAKNKRNDGWLYYYLYGLERVCSFTGTGRIGKNDWHGKGSEFLIKAQHSEGKWNNSESDTCFALLFLRRGSRTSGLGPRNLAAQAEARKAPFAIGMNSDHPFVAWVRRVGGLARDVETGESVGEFRWRIDGQVVKAVKAADPEELLDVGCHLQHAFDRNGRHTIQAEVELHATDGRHRTLASNVLEHMVDGVEEDWHREHERDLSRQVLHRTDLSVTASSELNAGRGGRFAADQRFATSWFCKPDDTRPWVKIDLRPGLRGSLIKVVQAFPQAWNRKNTARAKDIEIRINNRRPIQVRLEDRPNSKQYIPFSKTVVRSIRIDVTSLYPGVNAREKTVCGFAEVELFRDRHPEDLKKLPASTKYLLALARHGPVEWRYVFTAPPEGWSDFGFRGGAWKKGDAGFGSKASTFLSRRTEWAGKDVWARREFIFPRGDPGEVRLEICHDDDVTVWINGILALKQEGWSNDTYRTFAISPEAQAGIRSGRNVIAFHCRNTGGQGYVDVGVLHVANK